MDVGKPWGVGPKTRAYLNEAGIPTIGQIGGKKMRDLARGIGVRVAGLTMEPQRQMRLV